MVLTTSAVDSPSSSRSTSQGSKALQNIIFGSVAGILGKIIEYPFDTVKVRLQSQSASLPLRYIGPLDCLRQSITRDGFLSLYRGISAPLIGAAVETSSLFLSYRLAQEVASVALDSGAQLKNNKIGENEKLSLGPLVLCGAASGAFTSLFLTPIELIKCQMQVPPSSTTPAGFVTTQTTAAGPISIIKTVVRHRGLFGFWHGQMGTFIRETGGSAAWFGSYEAVGALFRTYNCRQSVNDKDGGDGSQPLHFYQQLLAGAAAGVNYNFVCFPADTIKSRMQTAEVGPPGAKAGGRRETFWESGRALWRLQGLKGMYRGCGITVARSAPSSAVIFAVEEALQGWWLKRVRKEKGVEEGLRT